MVLTTLQFGTESCLINCFHSTATAINVVFQFTFYLIISLNNYPHHITINQTCTLTYHIIHIVPTQKMCINHKNHINHDTIGFLLSKVYYIYCNFSFSMYSNFLKVNYFQIFSLT